MENSSNFKKIQTHDLYQLSYKATQLRPVQFSGLIGNKKIKCIALSVAYRLKGEEVILALL